MDREILKRSDAQRIAARDHQPHFARDETDDAILARIQPFARRLDALGPQGAVRQVQAREVAGALRQRDQRMLVADIAQIDADAGLAIEEFAQFCYGKAVAGMNADHRRALFEERLDLARQLLRQVFELRPEPGLHAFAGPYQPLAKRGEFRALAALGFDQRGSEELRPLLDQIPDVPVGQVRIAGRARDLSGLPDFVEHAEHDDCGARAALVAKSPDGLDLDLKHLKSL
ncbi:hypothetical protein AB7M69_005236 [Bradyrhizobium japonicum]